MTQDEKRVKIAEASGWTREGCAWKAPPGWKLEERYRFTDPPDYFGCLNACHEMEKMLTDEQWEGYYFHLWECAMKLFGRGDRMSHLPADQRAEAFGLTLKLWEPETGGTQP